MADFLSTLDLQRRPVTHRRGLRDSLAQSEAWIECLDRVQELGSRSRAVRGDDEVYGHAGCVNALAYVS